MSGIQCGLGTKSAQSSIRAMFPDSEGASNGQVHVTHVDLQKKLNIQDEKGHSGNSAKLSVPRALVIAGPSGVGKGTLIEVNHDPVCFLLFLLCRTQNEAGDFHAFFAF